MHTNPLSILLVCLILSVVSCTRDATVTIPETDEKPVVTCFISPQDSFITVSISRSQALYKGPLSPKPEEIKDALVFFGDENNSILIPYIKEETGYQIPAQFFPILAGKTYSLTIKLKSGETITSETTVPINEIQDFNLAVTRELLDSSEFSYSYEYLFNFSWQDKPGSGDQYRLLVSGLMFDSFLGSDTIAQTISEEYASDQDRDGTKIAEAISVSNSFFSENGVFRGVYSSFIGYLIQGNSDYIHYHSDLLRNAFNGPFSEPVINFSNINGGIGCFAAYRVKRVRVN